MELVAEIRGRARDEIGRGLGKGRCFGENRLRKGTQDIFYATPSISSWKRFLSSLSSPFPLALAERCGLTIYRHLRFPYVSRTAIKQQG